VGDLGTVDDSKCFSNGHGTGVSVFCDSYMFLNSNRAKLASIQTFPHRLYVTLPSSVLNSGLNGMSSLLKS
jgi:hypothetical protein